MGHIIIPPDEIPDPQTGAYLINDKSYRFIGYTVAQASPGPYSIEQFDTCLEAQCRELGWSSGGGPLHITMSASGAQCYENEGTVGPIPPRPGASLSWSLPDAPPPPPPECIISIVDVDYFAAKGTGNNFSPCYFAAGIVAFGAPYGFGMARLTDLKNGPITILVSPGHDTFGGASGGVTISLP